jgi:hypothetical protein
MVSPEKGVVSEGVYTNPYFGFSFTFPHDLMAKTTEFQRSLGKPHSRSTFVLLTAAAPTNTPMITLMADKASNYGGLTDGAAYLSRFTASMKAGGWSVLHAITVKTVRGKKFFRSDYYRNGAFESSMCTIYKGFALDFIVVGRNQKDIDRLVDSLDTLRFSDASLK